MITDDSLTILLTLGLVTTACALVGAILYLRRQNASLNKVVEFTEAVNQNRDYTLRYKSDIPNKQDDLGNGINQILDTLNNESQRNQQSTKRLMDTQVTLGRLSQYDSLTGLPNRRYFMETLERAFAQSKRSGQRIALMYLDLDGFKDVNDAHGHKVGDELLKAVAEKANTLIRQGDMIARLGGDEFLILLYNHPDEVLLNEIASRIASQLSQPYHIQAWRLQISVSIGIAIISDEDADVSEFINNADIAMYRSKQEGISKTTIYAPFMRSENKRRLEIANALDDAITHNEFHLVYQAKVDNKDEVVGYEALIRWNSDSLGFIPPDQFIEIAEQSGKIHMITLWVCEQVCQDMPRLLQLYGQDIRISFNLSVYDLQDPKLSETLGSIFKKYGVEGRHIELEITEYAYLNNFDMANHFFKAMADIDCNIALDDFGTGYSSLGYLTKININTLKIDKQFISDTVQSAKSMLVTKAIIEMAKQLGLNVCAEGVETLEQADFLKKNGCHYLQGYLYSQPKILAIIEKETADNKK